MSVPFDFAYFPILQTERLRLRRITHDDAAALVGLLGNADVLRYMSDDPPCYTLEQAHGLVDWIDGWFERRAAARWAITRRDDDTLIGTCGFHFLMPQQRRCDIGYDLMPTEWGKGYITEADPYAGALVLREP